MSGPVRGWTGPNFVGPGPGGEWTGLWGRTRVGPGPDLYSLIESIYYIVTSINNYYHVSILLVPYIIIKYVVFKNAEFKIIPTFIT